MSDAVEASVYASDAEFVAAGQTNKVCGPTGRKGDLLLELIIVPTSYSPGAVYIKDGSDAQKLVLTAPGTPFNLNQEVRPMPIRFGRNGIRSRTGAWQITTGAGVTVIAIGRFT